MTINNISYFFSAIILFISSSCVAKVNLPAIFSDHMVLEQKTKVNVWGWASPGEQVSIMAPWQSITIRTRADSLGNWKISLKTPAAGGPYNITIKGENSIELKDVLIGEVWICAGQSNMVFPLKYSDSAKKEIARANYPSIRYFGVKGQYGPQRFKDCAGAVWKKTTPETAASFSAVAYYFAKRIHQDIQVPIGIVCTAWSGTPAEAWTPKAILQHDDSLNYFLKRWRDIPQKVGKDSLQYHLELAQWEKGRAFSGNESNKPDEPRTYYYYKRPWCEPGVLFNGMISPLIPFTIKGVLWYQGESNVSEADKYGHLFTTMIKSWRELWKAKGQKLLPVYFVQIAPFGYSNPDAAARLRKAQYNVMKKVKHTGMVVTTDVGNLKNIHYTHKKEVGDRLALIALAKSYHIDNISYNGPDCEKVVRINTKLQLTFNQQLFTTGQSNAQCFEIGYKAANDSVRFIKAQSVIKGNKVIVWSDQVKEPLIVRYAWLEPGNAILINKAGLPAYPFQQQVL